MLKNIEKILHAFKNGIFKYTLENLLVCKIFFIYFYFPDSNGPINKK